MDTARRGRQIKRQLKQINTMYSFSSNDTIQVLKVDDLLNPLENQKIIKEIEQFIENGFI